MTVQALGQTSHFFTGEVRDIRDPDKQGKVKIHIHGHSNQQSPPTDDSDLHWCHTVMNNSPSQNGIGKTTHYLPGTTIFGMWLDPLTKQIPIIMGSLHKAGIVQGGTQGDIEPAGGIDTTYRSPPGGPNGQALDPSVLANVTKITQALLWSKSTFDWGYSQIGNQQNQGAQGSQDNAQVRAKNTKAQANPQWLQPNNATVASASPMNILLAIQSVDPQNNSGPIPKSLTAMIQLNQLASATSVGGAMAAASGALGSALQTVSSAVGVVKALGAVSAMSSGVSNSTVSTVINQATTGLLTNTGVGVFSNTYVQEAAGLSSAFSSIASGDPISVMTAQTGLSQIIASTPVGNSFSTRLVIDGVPINQTITVNQGGPPATPNVPIYTGNEMIDIATGAAEQTANTILSSIGSGNTASMIGMVEALINSIQAQGKQATTGSSSSNILQNMFSIIPQIAPTILNMVTELTNSLNNPTNINTLQQDAAMALSIAKQAWNISHMFDGTEAEQAAGVAISHAQSISQLATGTTQTLSTALTTITSTVASS